VLMAAGWTVRHALVPPRAGELRRARRFIKTSDAGDGL
jgi:hypothetical protein